MKRISFSQNDIEHLYELALEHFQDGCFDCERLKVRLQDFIGQKETRRIKRIVKKNSYCLPD